MIPDLNEGMRQPAEQWQPAKPVITMHIETDPEKIAQARKAHEDFKRNVEWWNEHVQDVPRDADGKFVAVAGRQLFIADTRKKAEELARAAHPDDAFVLILPIWFDETPRYYGFPWRLDRRVERANSPNDRSLFTEG
jgi:hypothetical protein